MAVWACKFALNMLLLCVLPGTMIVYYMWYIYMYDWIHENIDQYPGYFLIGNQYFTPGLTQVSPWVSGCGWKLEQFSPNYKPFTWLACRGKRPMWWCCDVPLTHAMTLQSTSIHVQWISTVENVLERLLWVFTPVTLPRSVLRQEPDVMILRLGGA